MEEYGFYGAEQARMSALTDVYPGIRTPGDLYRALLRLWSAETCIPRMRDHWKPSNPSYGQCSITAFLAQDIFGGRVYGVRLPNGTYHSFNEIDGVVFDLTSEQFGSKQLDYGPRTEQSRAEHFSYEAKRQNYERLREGLRQLTADGQSANPVHT